MQKQIKNRQDLEITHELYKSYKDDWELYDLVWESGQPLIEHALYKHPFESVDNWENRLRDGYVFNFGASIIDIFNFYLNEKEVVRTLPGLEDNKQWKMFLKDADLFGTDYNVLIDEAQKLASVHGSIGVLVNKPAVDTKIVSEEIAEKIYPYIALYSLSNILDWEWKKDPQTHRRRLVYLKLRESDGSYLLWWPDKWEIWKIIKDRPELTDTGENTLGEIPFVWMVNLKKLKHPEIGKSDLTDIAQIVRSIAVNLSCGEEAIKFAGFPIMREPMDTEDYSQIIDVENEEAQVPHGPQGIKQFNPEHGAHAKPDWMPTEIFEPVQAILNWIDRKADEIYRIAHLSGVHGQRKSNNEVASGLAIRYEFAQLNSVLIAKSINQNEAELQIIRLWLKWQNLEKIFDDIEIKRSHEFSIDEMAVAMDNAVSAYKAVASKTFRVRVAQKMAKATMPDLPESDFKDINEEIENNTPEEAEFIDAKTSTRSAYESRSDHMPDG
jgi:hypothetical protein